MIARNAEREESSLNLRTLYWIALSCGFAAHPIAAIGRYLWFRYGPPLEAYWGPPTYDWQMAFVSPLLPGFLILAVLLRKYPKFRIFRGTLARWRIVGVLTILTIPAVYLG